MHKIILDTKRCKCAVHMVIIMNLIEWLKTCFKRSMFSEKETIHTETVQTPFNSIQDCSGGEIGTKFLSFETRINQFLSQLMWDENTEVAFLYAPNNTALFPSVLFLTQYSKKHSILKNLFDDDTCDCYFTVFSKKDSDYIGLMDYSIARSKCIRDFSFYGISAEKILGILKYKEQKELPNQPIEHAVQSILQSLSSCMEDAKIPDVISMIDSSLKPINRNLHYQAAKFLQENCMLNRSLYADLYEIILKNLSIDSMQFVRWKSEFQLFLQVKHFFPDAVYQYHDYWLGQQSIDIFIPSKNIGIEYQGIQHYQPIDIFGGEEGFFKQKEKDERKRTICKKVGVSIVEWKYSEAINQLNLQEKLKPFVYNLPELNLSNSNNDVALSSRSQNRKEEFSECLEDNRKSLEKIWLSFLRLLQEDKDELVVSTWESILKDFKKTDLNSLFQRAVSDEFYGDKFLQLLVKSKTLLQYYLLNKPNLNYYKKQLLVYLIRYGKSEDFVIEQLRALKSLCVAYGNICDLGEFARVLCLEADDYQIDAFLARHVFREAGIKRKRKN